MPHPDKSSWPADLFNTFIESGVTLFPYIPDAGNARLIELAIAHNDSYPVLLTSEEEGVAVCAGADLVGKRGVLCMQSSGVGNCPNFLSLVKGGDFPILLMVSMRGDYGEQNPWQYPMGQAVEPILHAMGVLTFRVERPEELLTAATAALSASGKGGQAAALILSQKFLGAKAF
ncbi:MAG: phosphonopyruvate decarboxylase [Proteobacteria bacterium]|nr:phosphonopyruvate decarboxylase [Pseudomonadota bacterium]MDA1022341.1 phosphonopyruvate decarboxylase [Pseudomonadota bacterium]